MLHHDLLQCWSFKYQDQLSGFGLLSIITYISTYYLYILKKSSVPFPADRDTFIQLSPYADNPSITNNIPAMYSEAVTYFFLFNNGLIFFFVMHNNSAILFLGETLQLLLRDHLPNQGRKLISKKSISNKYQSLIGVEASKYFYTRSNAQTITVHSTKHSDVLDMTMLVTTMGCYMYILKC